METEADGNGDIVQTQEILAGNSITVYSIGRDVGGNFIENIALQNENDWSLIDVTGDIAQSALQASGNLRSATLFSQITGTAKIQASLTGTTLTPSDDITVLPRSADEIEINTQPPDTAIAGEAFSDTTTIHLLDQFGNIVTTDNSTTATISINSGQGTLSDTLSQQAVSGVISFPGLSSDIANTINLLIESDGLSSVTTNDIVVEPNDPADLEYLQQPTNTAQNGTISPAVELQLLDSLENNVSQSGVEVSISESEGSFLQDNSTSTFSDTTDANGVATFDNLIAQNSPVADVNLDASFTGINSPVTSNTFSIIGAGDLAKFVIETTSETEIDDQTAGEQFTIRIRALDGAGNVFTDFDDSVVLTADSDIQDGVQVDSIKTGNFVNGVLETGITLTSAGTTRIYAENTNRDGRSNEFSVLPANFDASTSEISADPDEIVADGSSTSTITVQLKDEFGNSLLTGGETVELATDFGTFPGDVSSITATDQNDGTYTAELTSSTNSGETAEITGTVNSTEITDNAEVDFIAGDVESFIIELPQDGGSPAEQIAGEPFDISIEAMDASGNRVSDFDGNATLTSNSTFSSSQSITFTSGFIASKSVTLTETGNDITISADADDLFDVNGESEPFSVVANDPDADASQIVVNPTVLQNDPGFQSQITAILRDEYNNRIRTDQSVNITLEQLEENSGPSPDGTPDASLDGGITWNSGPANYTVLLNATSTVELVRVTGSFGSPQTEITEKPEIDIVVPNTWTAGAGGSTTNRTDWTNADNWTSSVPTETDFVIIPDIGEVPTLDLNITIGSFEIQQGVSLDLFGGNAITVAGNVQTDGTLNIENNTDISLGGSFVGNGSFTAGKNATVNIGGNISVSSFLARTTGTIITLNGSSPQVISTQNLLAQNLNIRNDVTVSTGTDLLDINVLDIGDGYTFELEQGGGITFDSNQNITGAGTFLLNDNTLVLRSNAEFGNIDASEGTVIFGIRLDEDFANFPDIQQQQIANLTEMKSAIINNTEGVRTLDDVIIGDDGSLTLENGELIIGSGRNFIAKDITYTNGVLTFRRSINQSGWRLLSSPVTTTFENWFDGLTLQGITGTEFDERQPNLLFYDETYEGTDNQRWRRPVNATDNLTPGKGYFFYVFGNDTSDTDYNDTLPQTLSVSGQEHATADASRFDLNVTYTAEADTGFNLVGNPFGATINWDDESWVKQNMDNVIYIWDQASNQYKTWNGVSGSHNSGNIAPFQGFWVKANNDSTEILPSLQVSRNAKTTGGIFRKSQRSTVDHEWPVIEMQVEGADMQHSTHFTFTDSGRNNIDNKDAYRLLPFDTNTYLEIFALMDDGTELAITNLPRNFGKTIKLPLHGSGVKEGAFIDNTLSLSWPKLINIPDGWTITLLDNDTNKEINLLEENFYDFTLNERAKAPPVMNSTSNFQLVQKSLAKQQNARFTIEIDPGADAEGIPKEVELSQNFSNPFSQTTTIEFGLPIEQRAKIEVYDVLGRRVQIVTDRRFSEGYHQIEFNGRSLASGVYFYRLITEEKTIVKKMTLIK